MTTTWVVVAHRTGARIMEHRSNLGRTLTLVRELENPEGRKKDGELESDRPGESFTGQRGLGGQRAMHHEQPAHEHVVERFAHEIAKQLSRARAENLYAGLVLVAEPKFLGMLRAALDPTTTQRVVGSVNKDLAAVPSRDVMSHLGDVLS